MRHSNPRLRSLPAVILGCGAMLAICCAWLISTPGKAQTASTPTFLLGADISALDSGRGGGGAGAARRGRGATGPSTNPAFARGGARAGAARGPTTGPSTNPAFARAGGARRGGAIVYRETADGPASTEYAVLKNHGWNAFRLRVFVDPVRPGAPNNSLANTIPLAKQIKDTGAVLLVDLHYSDTWADPEHQEIPHGWLEPGDPALTESLRQADIDQVANYSKLSDADKEKEVARLEQKVEENSRDVISQLKAAGAMPDMVQVGNEITLGMLWPVGRVQNPSVGVQANQLVARQQELPTPYNDDVQWSHLIRFINAGIKGVMEGAGDTPPRIMIHTNAGGDWTTTNWFFSHLAAANVKYDIIGQSFYTYAHDGTPDTIWENMNNCAQKFGKDFVIVETGYGRTGNGPDNPFNLWPITPDGRLQFIADLVNTVKKAPHGLGVFYWAPESDLWNTDGTPGPTVFVQDRLSGLTTRPSSHAPTAVNP